ncbi:MAG TPA: class I SAM-dependent methyltransferase [Gaiellaceae bacterium]|nr:class I SAM-dependent methyltransferase [Gaiellaceae bacterium]
MSDVLAEQMRYYAERAPEYDDWWYRRGRYTRDAEHERRWLLDVAELEERLRSFAPRGDVLELAAGTGIWTRRLVPTANRMVAVDANAETLALNTPAAELVVADIFSWRPPQQFDVVFFSFWLSHVPEDRFAEFWALVRSALRPDGRVFLIDSGPPEAVGDGELQVRQLADGREFTIVKRFWQPNELAERVAELGFELDLRLTGNGLFLHGGSA